MHLMWNSSKRRKGLNLNLFIYLFDSLSNAKMSSFVF